MPSITVQQVLDYARTHAKLAPVLGIGGISNEPGLSICNDVIQELLSAPFSWKFNRVYQGATNNTYGNFFVTQPFIQDYKYAGAIAFVLPLGGTPNAISSTTTVGGVGIELASNNGISRSGTTVTVITLDPHPFTVGQTVFIAGATVAAYNATFTANNTTLRSTWSGGHTITTVADTLHFTYTQTGSPATPSGAPGVTDWGWIDSAGIQDIQNTVYPQFQSAINAVENLALATAGNGIPEQLAMIHDYGTGVLQFRVHPILSSYIWQVNFTFQKQPKNLTATSDTFGTWPYYLGYVIRQGVLARTFNLIDEARSTVEYQKFQMAIQKALIREESERDSEGFAPTRPLLIG